MTGLVKVVNKAVLFKRSRRLIIESDDENWIKFVHCISDSPSHVRWLTFFPPINLATMILPFTWVLTCQTSHSFNLLNQFNFPGVKNDKTLKQDNFVKLFLSSLKDFCGIYFLFERSELNEHEKLAFWQFLSIRVHQKKARSKNSMGDTDICMKWNNTCEFPTKRVTI